MRTHLPPTIPVLFIFLYNFYTFTGTKGDLVVVLWDKVVSSVNVFEHKEGWWDDGEGRSGGECVGE